MPRTPFPDVVTEVVTTSALTTEASPPLEVGRAPARGAAGAELERHIYLSEDPGTIARSLSWVREQVTTLTDTVLSAVSFGAWPVLAIPLLVLIVVAVVRWYVGPLARNRGRADLHTTATPGTAADHWRAATAADAAGDVDTALREWFQALVRDLEERAVVPPRTGRTAGEVAHEVTTLDADAGPPVRVAAQAFDAVCYGGRVPTADTVALVRAGAEAARAVRGDAGADVRVDVGAAR